jgi:hypothetical protein
MKCGLGGQMLAIAGGNPTRFGNAFGKARIMIPAS